VRETYLMHETNGTKNPKPNLIKERWRMGRKRRERKEKMLKLEQLT
jgi:hypothetical protein